MIGWNEILRGGRLMKSATVQSGEDSSWTRRAVVEGHDAMASPAEWTYLNRLAGELTVDPVYGFDQIPPGLTRTQSARVLGAETPLWSEHITSPANLELMAYPRMLVFSEVMWSGRVAARDFARALTSLHERLATDSTARPRGMCVAVGPADRVLMRIAVSYETAARAARVRTMDGVAGVIVRGSDDGRAPTASSPLVADSSLLRGEGVRRFQPFLGTVPVLAERQGAVCRVDPHESSAERALVDRAAEAGRVLVVC